MCKLIIILSICMTIFFSTNCYSEVLLDIGHTNLKYGAMSCSGKREYDYNKELVKYITSYLFKKNIKFTLTNDYNNEINLIDRTKNTKSKKLLISIHHDSAQKKYIKYINGNPCSDRFRGFSIFVSRKNVFFKESVEYAKVLGQMLKSYGLNNSVHHNEKIKGENREFLDKELGIFIFDDLVVLKHAKCPALLLEAAVIINPEDEILSSSNRFKKIIAKSIYKTIISR